MEENVMNGEMIPDNAKKSVFTVKNVMRVLSLLCIVFVFCPSFLVSCSGQNMNVSVMTAVEGISAQGRTFVEPYPIMLVCLLLPIAIVVFLFLKKFSDMKNATIILGCAAVDFIIWIIFAFAVKNAAEEYYCTFKVTAWYVFDLIALLLIIALSLLVVLKKLEMEADLVALVARDDARKVLNKMSDAVSQASEALVQKVGEATADAKNKKVDNAIGYCAKCGSAIAYGCKFCTSCGTPVPENMLAEAEEAKKKEEEARLAEEVATAQNAEVKDNVPVCHNCGSEISADAMFCEKCGTKVKE